MKTNALITTILLASLCASLSYSNNSGITYTSPSESKGVFNAEGNTDPDHRAPRRKKGEVVVTFDLLPTRMNFNLPSFPCLVTENNISYYNGWTETYDAAAGVGSCEPLMDRDNVYSRMWIESPKMMRASLCAGGGRWSAPAVLSRIKTHRPFHHTGQVAG